MSTKFELAGLRSPQAIWGTVLGGAAVLCCLTAFVVERPGVPDFTSFQAGPDRKSEFLAFLHPLIESENREVLAERELLERIAGEPARGWLDRLRLRRMADKYDLDDADMDDASLIEALLRRADIVPPSLALAQAAKESGWGTSRFALQGNNLFGEWCYEPGCGLVPQQRPAGRRYEVQSFVSPRDSVRSYLLNINTHDGYQDFRRERARLRAAGRALSGLLLADQLAQYSERRDAYVEDIKRLIWFNELTELARVASD